MRIGFVVGELKALEKYKSSKRSKNGFHSFMISVQYRVDDAGHVDIDDEDFAKIRLYSRNGYKKRLLEIFGRNLGPDFDASHTGWL